MGRGGGAALPTSTTRGDVLLMVVNISMIVLVTVVVASCTGNYGCAGLLPRCHDEERRALLQMKEYSSVLRDWPGVAGGEDCCHWRGITCNNHTGRVIRIDLPLEDISPNLASTLVQFKELESLDLVWNTISATLPNLLCNFKHLKQLHLHRVNSSSWSIPSCLGNLNNLEELSLSGIDSTFPEVLCNMRSLTSIELVKNSLHESMIPSSCFGNLHNLERLRLRENNISGSTFLHGLCNIRTLTSLQFFYNRINGTIPSCLGNLHNLERLNLYDNEISGTIPEGLCNLRHLKELDLSGNRRNGTIPSCLGNLHNLEWLHLQNNEFQGSIPPSIFPNLTKLTRVLIGGGRLEGTFSFSAFANLSNLEEIFIGSSKYGLEIEIESPSWVPSFQLRLLIIYGCSVVNKGNGGGGGGRFPAGFISTQTRLAILQLEDNQMTGTLPLWVLCNISSLSVLRLRGNKLGGTFHLAPSCNASRDLSYIDLSHNLLHGSLPTDVGFFFPNLGCLLMAGNQLEGPIPPSLGQAPYLLFLDLSDNQLSGKLPHTLTRNQTALEYLNVSCNQLVGEMLPKDTYMPALKFLYLHHNSFTGSIPPMVSNFSNLVALDVGHNHLKCSLSHCLPSVPSMIALSLRKNRLQGHLPTHHLCGMQHLHLLDLFGNNLTGKIPPCLTNISFWNRKAGTDGNDDWVPRPGDVMGFASKRLLIPYQGVPLNMMAGLDMSSNRLDGVIPWEIGELKGLRSLNLSNNHLEGSLPRSMGNMESLESLDLSHNNLNGSIPHETVQLHFLSTFCVAFNNLSGEIPSQGQFSTFSKSDFEGNPELCGAPPLERNCSSDAVDDDQKEADIEEGPSLWDNSILFYSWLVLSFALGFWGVIATMVLNRRWRIKFFRVVDDFFRWISK